MEKLGYRWHDGNTKEKKSEDPSACVLSGECTRGVSVGRVCGVRAAEIVCVRSKYALPPPHDMA